VSTQPQQPISTRTLARSNCEKVREEAQKELVEFLKKTMSSTYDLVEEDFIHEALLSTSIIQDDDNEFLKKTMSSTYDLVEEDFIHETQLSTSNIHDLDNISDPSENDLVVNLHIDETPTMAEQDQIGPVTCCKKL
jgi:hypothetical protein